MHEYSIVQALLDSCEDHARQNDATKVSKVIIKVGVLSGVEPQLLTTAFNTFKEGTMCDGADFVLNQQKVVIECSDCKDTNTLEKHEFLCPNCHSKEVNVIDGEDMYLMSLEME